MKNIFEIGVSVTDDVKISVLTSVHILLLATQWNYGKCGLLQKNIVENISYHDNDIFYLYFITKEKDWSHLQQVWYLFLQLDFLVDFTRGSVQSRDFLYVLPIFQLNLLKSKYFVFCRFHWKLSETVHSEKYLIKPNFFFGMEKYQVNSGKFQLIQENFD